MTIDKVRAELMLLEDRKNAKRSSSITPNAKPVLGARLPDLRRLAKQIAKKDYRAFLEQCPDDFFEWQVLQAFVLGYAKDDIETGDWCVNDSFCQSFQIARQNRAHVWE